MSPVYPANVTFTNGVGTATITLYNAASTTLSATDGTKTGSSTFTVGTGRPAKLIWNVSSHTGTLSSPLHDELYLDGRRQRRDVQSRAERHRRLRQCREQPRREQDGDACAYQLGKLVADLADPSGSRPCDDDRDRHVHRPERQLEHDPHRERQRAHERHSRRQQVETGARALKRRRSCVDKKAMDFVLPLVFVPGLAIGSFLGVVAARVPLRRSVVHPGSACMSCEAPIRWHDNVPVLSYALLRGRCRKCGTRIPPRDLAIELTTACLLVGCVLAFGLTLEAAAAAVGCAALVVATATDLERRIVPNRVVLPAFVAVLTLNTIAHPSPEWALGAAGAAGFLLLAALAYPGGMGMGDVKLALLIGALLGRTTPVGLMLGLLLALVPSAVLLARHGARARRLAIPFAPFLAAGAIVALFAGEYILHAYLRTF